VHLGIPALLDFYSAHCNEESLVLATIVATEGSSYRKPGAMMLISRDGQFEGMISGGCLEGDLLHHAARVFESGQPSFVTYDMHADDEMVWGLGLGCDGVIHLMLQRLDRDRDFGFLKQLHASHEARQAVLLALVTKPGKNIPCGVFALLDQSDISVGDPDLRQSLQALAGAWPEWRMRTEVLQVNGEDLTCIQVQMPARTRVLICGGGPDSVPLARVLSELDWEVQVIDHRPAFANKDRYPPACLVTRCSPALLSESVKLDDVDAVVIMSHHLENDAQYLRQITGFNIPYIGALGPRARRERLREMAGNPNLDVHGPAGLDIGAELPSSIALSIAAEIHAVLNLRNGRSLMQKADAQPEGS
jgi:xanthine dehydrogenase accessory factor